MCGYSIYDVYETVNMHVDMVVSGVTPVVTYGERVNYSAVDVPCLSRLRGWLSQLHRAYFIFICDCVFVYFKDLTLILL